MNNDLKKFLYLITAEKGVTLKELKSLKNGQYVADYKNRTPFPVSNMTLIVKPILIEDDMEVYTFATKLTVNLEGKTKYLLAPICELKLYYDQELLLQNVIQTIGDENFELSFNPDGTLKITPIDEEEE